MLKLLIKRPKLHSCRAHISSYELPGFWQYYVPDEMPTRGEREWCHRPRG